MRSATERLEQDGFALLPALFSAADCQAFAQHTQGLASERAGTRNLLHASWCQRLATDLAARLMAAGVLPSEAIAVQCTYFEKTAAHNWLVAPHQDLSIPVAAPVPHVDWGGVAQKEGVTYAQPPARVLSQLLAARLHLDPCCTDDGPLRVRPGSHVSGVLTPAQISTWPGAEVTCTADAGDVLLMRPLLLHASSKASGTSRRRVLHFLFGPAQLPDGARWPSIAS
ncbi:phytanoyl-CoA dioxygenase family protein [Ottowia testudinis]|uniref:Phytanoyl-CoA dioxygenase family protein n=1 Tax=Ottowia testudinis TaxID=2816950 RepID=A0A975CJ04_9BURK|nr:phytanoyl-CoA dioxygenase family protein [Ottowia testudinis]QTD45971.1 phytanoyl-CoA dioxygenase family protein [Ottowia testudinis]